MQQSVLLKTPLTAFLGYGNDGFALARAFYQHGLDIHLLPVATAPPIPAPVAQLLTKDPLDDFDFLVHHIDPGQIGLTDGEKRISGKKIAWTMWEFTKMDPKVAEDLTWRLDGYDLLMCYDEISAQAMQPFADEAGVPIKILQGGIWSEEWVNDTPQARDWSGPFRFVMVGQLHERKNPFAAIAAFNEVKEKFPQAELHLKTNIRGLHPGIADHNPGIHIWYERWSQEKLKAFYAASHCYVAPSWGEGKNLPALEAQCMGIPAIYSNFGGHKQWGDSSIGWPVAGTIGEHAPGLGSWRVDHDDLVRCMTEAVSNVSTTREKGMKAANLIPAQCDWMKVVDRLLMMTQ